MRVSTNKDDPGYSDAFGARYSVTLDGRPMKYCIMADDVRGEVQVLEVDSCGSPVFDQVKREFSVLLFHGKVKIILT